MSQADAYTWLLTQRQTGEEGFFTVKQMREGIQGNGGPRALTRLSIQVSRLAEAGFLDYRVSGKVRPWRRVYRLKDKYLIMSRQKGGERARTP